MNFDTLKFSDNGLIPAVIQDSQTKQVLMVGWMNKESLILTQTTRTVHFFSRSRERLWQKGETSGNYLNLVEMYVDCDLDTVLIMVNPAGPTCHTGNVSCFFQPIIKEE